MFLTRDAGAYEFKLWETTPDFFDMEKGQWPPCRTGQHYLPVSGSSIPEELQDEEGGPTAIWEVSLTPPLIKRLHASFEQMMAAVERAAESMKTMTPWNDPYCKRKE